MIPENIGQNIRQARKAQGITQEQLAARLYVSRQTVSSWENARTQPDYETLQKLSEVLSVSVGELLGVAKEPYPQEAPPEAEPSCVPPADAPPSVFPNDFVVRESPSVPLEVVQPPEEPAANPRRQNVLLLTALCTLVCILWAAWRFALPDSYSPEQFMKSVAPVEGQAFVTLYTRECRVNLPSGKSYPSWNYNLYLREDHGVGFQIETLRCVYFLEDDQTVSLEYNAADIARMKQTSHLNGYGLMVLTPGYTPSNQNPSHPVGVGVMLEGRDDGMHAQTYTLYIPFDPWP